MDVKASLSSNNSYSHSGNGIKDYSDVSRLEYDFLERPSLGQKREYWQLLKEKIEKTLDTVSVGVQCTELYLEMGKMPIEGEDGEREAVEWLKTEVERVKNLIRKKEEEWETKRQKTCKLTVEGREKTVRKLQRRVKKLELETRAVERRKEELEEELAELERDEDVVMSEVFKFRDTGLFELGIMGEGEEGLF